MVEHPNKMDAADITTRKEIQSENNKTSGRQGEYKRQSLLEGHLDTALQGSSSTTRVDGNRLPPPTHSKTTMGNKPAIRHYDKNDAVGFQRALRHVA